MLVLSRQVKVIYKSTIYSVYKITSIQLTKCIFPFFNFYSLSEYRILSLIDECAKLESVRKVCHRWKNREGGRRGRAAREAKARAGLYWGEDNLMNKGAKTQKGKKKRKCRCRFVVRLNIELNKSLKERNKKVSTIIIWDSCQILAKAPNSIVF